MANDKNDNDGQPNLPELRNEFHAAVTQIVEAAGPTEKVSACVETLVQHVGRLGINDINTDYAQSDFQRALNDLHDGLPHQVRLGMPEAASLRPSPLALQDG